MVALCDRAGGGYFVTVKIFASPKYCLQVYYSGALVAMIIAPIQDPFFTDLSSLFLPRPDIRFQQPSWGLQQEGDLEHYLAGAGVPRFSALLDQAQRHGMADIQVSPLPHLHL